MPDLTAEIGARVQELAEASQALAHPKSKTREYRDRVQDWWRRFSAPPIGPEMQALDPYLYSALLRGLGDAAVLLSEGRQDDNRAELAVAIERARQALRDFLEVFEGRPMEPTGETIRWLLAQLKVPQPDLAELLGTHSRTLQRWAQSDQALPLDAAQAARVSTLVRATQHLRHALTGPGTVRWLKRPHPDLHGQPPAALLDEPDATERLLRLASRARSNNAA